MANEMDEQLVAIGLALSDPAARAARIEEINRAAAHDAPPDVIRMRLRQLVELHLPGQARELFGAMFYEAIEIMTEQGFCLSDGQIEWLARR